MILGIMQPYFFPYLGYFDLINSAGRWVVFDTAQYIRHGWVNRNRILHPQKGWQYIVVPLKKHHRESAIKDIEVNESSGWQERMLGQIQHYKKKAPFFHETSILVEECLAIKERFLSRLNVAILEKCCRYINVPFRYEYFSEMNLKIRPADDPGDWAVRISEALGAEEYLNPPGGASFLDPLKFKSVGTKLTFRNLPPLEYRCPGYSFIAGMSVIDVLMWNPPGIIKEFLDNYKNGKMQTITEKHGINSYACRKEN